jgi:hypothetical protein
MIRILFLDFLLQRGLKAALRTFIDFCKREIRTVSFRGGRNICEKNVRSYRGAIEEKKEYLQ